MALLITHAFVSAKADGVDTTLIQPSNWNAALTTSMATGKVLGRATAGTGVIEELATTGTGNVVLSASPTFTGTITAAGITASGQVNGVKTVYNGAPAYNGGSGTDIGVSGVAISQAQGVLFMAYCACQNAGGSGTYAAVYLIRVNSTGSGITATRIALDAGSTGLGDYTFTLSGSVTIIITPPGNVNTLVVLQQMTG